MNEQIRTEEFKVNGDVLVAEIKKLVHEGNVRRIIIKNDVGQTLIEVPLTVGVVGGVVGAVLLPVWAAIGAIAALAVNLTLVVEKVEETQKEVEDVSK
jgi:Domain of unknown function (DUF4342)